MCYIFVYDFLLPILTRRSYETHAIGGIHNNIVLVGVKHLAATAWVVNRAPIIAGGRDYAEMCGGV
jgi:hypothetical protein